jgi:hypothetical protein
MVFDSVTRGKLQRLVTACRNLLTDEFDDQLQSIYGIHAEEGLLLDLDKLASLDDDQRVTGALLRERIAHLQSGLASSRTPLKDAVQRVLREQAFTVLNRFAALRMAEERELVLQCVGEGLNSKGFQVFESLAGPDLGSQYERYCVFLGCLFDELSLDLGVLFDRSSPFGLLFPREPKLKEFFQLLNDPELKSLWREDETIGWIYQYFNDESERKKMREESSAPRNSRELAVRNQFFTPRYVVEFLVDNTLGRLWYEMTRGETPLRERCRYLVRRPTEIFLKPGESVPDSTDGSEKKTEGNLSQEELLRQPVYISHRPLKDPREIRLLDPACGSMHFGLYAFDLFETIYVEWWDNLATEQEKTQLTADLQEHDSSPEEPRTDNQQSERARFLRHVPRLIVEYNIHGIEIDPRCIQIAGLSLWLRAQRAWHQAGVKAGDRPRITRSNLVCAEPMPGEQNHLQQFCESLKQPVIGQMVEVIFDKMRLAGEAGSLLKIEEEIRDLIHKTKLRWTETYRFDHESDELFSRAEIAAASRKRERTEPELNIDFSGITDESFWEKAEERIYAALEAYAEQAENGGGFQRRLFADDAAQGFAFIDLCRKRYDVVVMNPPFGRATVAIEDWCKEQYENAYIDIYACFVTRCRSVLISDGYLGAITARSFFNAVTLERFRDDIIPSLALLIELGGQVLDSALVDTALTILGARAIGDNCICIDLTKTLDKQVDLQSLVQSSDVAPNRFVVARQRFMKMPNRQLLYSLANQNLRTESTFDPAACHVRAGLNTFDDFRFLRLWWEVPPSDLGQDRTWCSHWKGGDYETFYSEIGVVCKWSVDGKEMRAVNFQLHGMEAQAKQSSAYYFDLGAAYTYRSSRGFSVRVFPAGCTFAVNGPVIQPTADFSMYYILGWLNSELIRALVHAQANANLFTPGLIKGLPWIAPTEEVQRHIASMVEGIIQRKAEEYARHETGRYFASSRLLFPDQTLREASTFLESKRKEANSLIVDFAKKITNEVIELYSGIISVDWKNHAIAVDDHRLNDEVEIGPFDCVALSLSQLMGFVFGRWDIRYATGERPAPELPDPFTPLPVCPPGMLQGDDGLPLSPEAGRRLRGEDRYPLNVAWDGILVDDPEHPLDLEALIHAALALLWGDRADEVEHEACALLGVPTLRDWFRRPTGFFADQLKRYSKSRRQAPIYWPLSTASGSYTLWLYYHRVNTQTLYTCVTDFVKPKLDTVTADAERLQAKTQTGGSAKERAELQALRDFQAELQELHDELLRVAQLPWKPNLNDGVLITASPLWKLFRLPKWQKDLKAC